MQNVNTPSAAHDTSAATEKTLPPDHSNTSYGSFFRTAAELAAARRALLVEHMAMAEELAALPDVDWGTVLRQPDVDPAIWRQPIACVSGENKYATDLARSDLCVGAVALLALSRVTINPTGMADPKDSWFITLTDIEANEQLGCRPRHAALVIAQYGIQIEDDGSYTAEELREAVRHSGYLTAMYSTASHGKSVDYVRTGDYAVWAIKNKVPRNPTVEMMTRYLNRGLEAPAYRAISFDPEQYVVIGGYPSYEITFEPQHRTRALVMFKRPLNADLLRRLRCFKRSDEQLGQRIGEQVFGRRGFDRAGFRLVQPAYLPSCIMGRTPPAGFEPWAAVEGCSLFDAVPVAEQLLAELEAAEAARPKPGGTTTQQACSEVPAGLRKSLRGVRLASLIAELHPELLRDQSDQHGSDWTDGNALYLAECPHSDGHSVRRGQADGTTYVFDPNGTEHEYPVIKCWHRSCADRTTSEFVEAMIERGWLTRAEVYDNAAYRDIYEYRYDGPHVHDGHNLKAWLASCGKSFKIVKLLDAKGLVAVRRPDGSVVTRQGEFARDGDGRRGFAFGRERLEGIMRLLGEQVISIADLESADFGGAPVPKQRTQHRNMRSMAVLDREGRGIDCAVFHREVAKPGKLDVARLAELAGRQIAGDLTAEQLLEFVEAGAVTVAQLVECSRAPRQPETDPYRAALRHLAGRAAEMLARELTDAQARIAAEHKVKPNDVESDFKRILSDIDAEDTVPGILSAEEAALVLHMQSYAKRFAIIGQGGAGYVLDLHQSDLSRATMTAPSFDLLYRNEWFPGDNGRPIYPARCFLSRPPRDAQVYRGGLVFRPDGTVAPDEYNTFRGFRVEPDESGSYDLLKKLLSEVWAHGDDELYRWVLEWFYDILAHPGRKCGTSIAIRGEYGDGKSIVTEKCMSKILGETQGGMLLRVADQNAVLGDFNEAMLGRLLVVLEEAAFSGDKKSFDRLKELVTGSTVSINQKNKARFTIENHARMLVASNHDHFMHVKPNDRRYTVLESTGAWRGNKRHFAALLDQWNRGGAERFLYDALNHEFRRLHDGSGALAISSKVQTAAEVDQVAESRSPLEKCLVGFLLRGRFGRPQAGLVELQDNDPGFERTVWELDQSLEIGSERLENAVNAWLRDSKLRGSEHGASLKLIVKKLEELIGETADKRPKVKQGGKWVQGGTVRVLPTRSKALVHAWTARLLTAEEYLSVGHLDDEQAEAIRSTA